MALAAKQKDKVRRWIRVIMVFVAALLLLFAAAIPIVNNAIALGVEKDLKNLPLPEKTELIETTSKAGKFVGSGNGMQYFGAILIRSEKTLDELSAYYSQKLADVVVKEQNTQKIQCVEHGGLSFKTQITATEDYYIVYLFGSGNALFSELDIRGH
jgi:hypothetical protein